MCIFSVVMLLEVTGAPATDGRARADPLSWNTIARRTTGKSGGFGPAQPDDFQLDLGGGALFAAGDDRQQLLQRELADMGVVVAPAVQSEQVDADIEPKTVAAAAGKDMVRIAAIGGWPPAPFAAAGGAELVEQRFVDDLHVGPPT